MITIRTSSSETDFKKSKLGASGGAERLKESVLEKESLILLFSEKKVTKWHLGMVVIKSVCCSIYEANINTLTE